MGVTWEELGFKIWKYKVVVLFFFLYIAMSFVMQYLIKTNKIKPSKISRIFYDDDDNFIKSWGNIKMKGLTKYIIKEIITFVVVMEIIGLILNLNSRYMYGFEQNQTIVIALITGSILGAVNALLGWGVYNDRYKKIIENLKHDN
jgi:hypothetical protein